MDFEDSEDDYFAGEVLPVGPPGGAAASPAPTAAEQRDKRRRPDEALAPPPVPVGGGGGPVAVVLRLDVGGVRNFSPDRPQSVEFGRPVTVLVGPNGAGKTTIIESLLYATTGSFRPRRARGTSGQAFVHDPKLLGQQEVLAKVALTFRGQGGGDNVVVHRQMRLTQQANGKLKFAAETPAIRVGTRQAFTGATVETINRAVQGRLGVSESMLQYVQFCHQEDSLWPVEDTHAVFEAIFEEEATRYYRALDALDKERKELKDRAKRSREDLRTHHDQLKELTLAQQDLEAKTAALAHLEAEWAVHKATVASCRAEVEARQTQCGELDRLEQNARDLERDLQLLSEELQHNREENQGPSLPPLSMNEPNEEDEEEEEYMDGEEDQAKKLQEEEMEAKRESEKCERAREQADQERKKAQMALQHATAHRLQCDSELAVLQARSTELIGRLGLHGADRMDLAAWAEVQTALEQAVASLDLDAERSAAQSQAAEAQARLSDQRAAVQMLESQRTTVLQSIASTAAAQSKRRPTKTSKPHSSPVQGHEILEVEEDMKEPTMEELDECIQRLRVELSQCQPEERHSLDSNDKEKEEQVEHSHESDPREESELKLIQSLRAEWKQQTHRVEQARSVRQRLQKMEQSAAGQVAQLWDEVCEGLPGVRAWADVERLSEQAAAHARAGADAAERLYASESALQVAEARLRTWEERARMRIAAGVATELELKALLPRLEAESVPPAARRRAVEHFVQWLSRTSSAEPNLPSATHLLQWLDQYFQSAEFCAHSAEEMQRLEILRQLPAVSDTLWTDEDEAKLAVESMRTEHAELRARHEAQQANAEAARLAHQLLGKYRLAEASHQSAQSESHHALQEEAEPLRQLDALRTAILTHSPRWVDPSSTPLLEDVLDQWESAFRANLQRSRDIRAELERLASQRRHVEHRRAVDAQLLTARRVEASLAELSAQKDEAWRRAEEAARVGRREADELRRLFDEARLTPQASTRRAAAEAAEAGARQHAQTAEAHYDLCREQAHKAVHTAAECARAARQRSRARECRRKRAELRLLRRHLADVGSSELRRLLEQAMAAERQATKAEAAAEGAAQVVAEQVARLRDVVTGERAVKAQKSAADLAAEVVAVELVMGDAARLREATQEALRQFHARALGEINDIIRLYWQATYAGGDVATVRLVAEEKTGGGIRGGRASYMYRLVMVRDAVELEMGLRCSAGQKVLTSLIVRLALAQVFCPRCPVLALDEPTTNLDDANVRRLAATLLDLIGDQDRATPLQLIIITHDEAFAELLRQIRPRFCRVLKDDRGFSVIVSESS